jgi:hypothetical protein
VGEEAAMKKFSPVAFYVSKRRRSEWLSYEADELEQLLLVLARRRLATTFGTWRRKRKTSSPTSP